MSRFAQRVFTAAGVYGLLVLTPQYFIGPKLARESPTGMTRPELFYGFIGVALAWQFVFLRIGRQPQALRFLMPIAILEKLAFGLPVVVLYAQQRVDGSVLGFGLIDLVLALLFAASWWKLRDAKLKLSLPVAVR